jgi:CubicO group peptidase (beta-lactamase class C family)
MAGNFTATDIIQNLQYLKPVSGFRTKYDYDNLLYIVAGEVIHVVSGKAGVILSKSVLWNR